MKVLTPGLKVSVAEKQQAWWAVKRSGLLSQDYVTFTAKPSTSVLGQGSVVEFIEFQTQLNYHFGWTS